VFRLFINQDWGTQRGVGLSSFLHFPDFSVGAVKAIVTFLAMGQVVLSNTTVLEEFTSLSILLGLQFINEQVTDYTAYTVSSIQVFLYSVLYPRPRPRPPAARSPPTWTSCQWRRASTTSHR
jgi:hypothetical protein